MRPSPQSNVSSEEAETEFTWPVYCRYQLGRVTENQGCGVDRVFIGVDSDSGVNNSTE